MQNKASEMANAVVLVLVLLSLFRKVERAPPPHITPPNHSTG